MRTASDLTYSTSLSKNLVPMTTWKQYTDHTQEVEICAIVRHYFPTFGGCWTPSQRKSTKREDTGQLHQNTTEAESQQTQKAIRGQIEAEKAEIGKPRKPFFSTEDIVKVWYSSCQRFTTRRADENFKQHEYLPTHTGWRLYTLEHRCRRITIPPLSTSQQTSMSDIGKCHRPDTNFF